MKGGSRGVEKGFKGASRGLEKGFKQRTVCTWLLALTNVSGYP